MLYRNWVCSSKWLLRQSDILLFCFFNITHFMILLSKKNGQSRRVEHLYWGGQACAFVLLENRRKIFNQYTSTVIFDEVIVLDWQPECEGTWQIYTFTQESHALFKHDSVCRGAECSSLLLLHPDSWLAFPLLLEVAVAASNSFL